MLKFYFLSLICLKYLWKFELSGFYLQIKVRSFIYFSFKKNFYNFTWPPIYRKNTDLILFSTVNSSSLSFNILIPFLATWNA